MNMPVQYMNNQMFKNNPICASNIHDNNFYQQMMMHKEEQLRRIKNISDLGLTREQITEYVIAPIKIEKSDKCEIDRMFDEENNRCTKDFIEKNWWTQRTNAPYKNILKDEDWKKDFKKLDDLVVHRVTGLDKVGLMEDYHSLLNIIEKHNGQLKVIFSASKESEHKKAFKFVQKYRDRMKYNPKDYNDLKEYYKTEQKKYEHDQKRIEEAITRLMDEDIEDMELKQIESEFLKPKTKKNKQILQNKDKEADIDRQLQELIEEFGEEVLKELENEEEPSEHVTQKKSRIQIRQTARDDESCDNENATQKHSRIHIKKNDTCDDENKKNISENAIQKHSRIRICQPVKDEPENKKVPIIKITTKSDEFEKDLQNDSESGLVRKVRIRRANNTDTYATKETVASDIGEKVDSNKNIKKIRINRFIR